MGNLNCTNDHENNSEVCRAKLHEYYLEIERTFYEFLNNEKREDFNEERDFSSVFIYL